MVSDKQREQTLSESRFIIVEKRRKQERGIYSMPNNEKQTSRVPVFRIQKVKEIDFKNSAFRNTTKINIFMKRTMLCTGIDFLVMCFVCNKNVSQNWQG